jgi:hypothetical protein
MLADLVPPPISSDCERHRSAPRPLDLLNESLGRPTLLRLDGFRFALWTCLLDSSRPGKSITVSLEIELPIRRVSVSIDGHGAPPRLME